MGRTYTAFISYRHAPRSSAAAEMIHKLIERYRIPKKLRTNGQKRLGYVFRDREELPVSSDLSADIRAALDASEHLIVICTPETISSPWVAREIEYFLDHHDWQRVFAVLAAGEPGEVFPKALTEVDGIPNAVEPLALDIRANSESGMRRRLCREIFRLYAALIGCPYDALVLRHQRRKLRIALGAAALIVAVAVGFSGMLLLKNQQLADQKAEVQLRESELLVQSARESLREGDYATAAMQAAAALPAGENERPYVAAAEQVLIQALGIFDDQREDYFQTKTTVQLTAPAADLCISDDGSRFAAVDHYGAVSCHDGKTGKKLWEMHLDAEEGEDLLPGAAGTLIAVGGGQMTALDWENGEKLWTYENNHMVSYVVSEDRTKIALVEQRFLEEAEGYEFSLVILSSNTGEVLCKAKFATGALTEPTDELPYIVLQEKLGAFSADGSLFVGGFCTQTTEGDELLLYTVDMKTGSVQTCSGRSVPSGAFSCSLTQLYVTEDAIYALYRMRNSANAVAAEKLDLATGELLWKTVTPAEEAPFADQDIICCLRTASSLYIARKDAVYTVDTHTGAAERSGTLSGNIFSMEIVEERYFAFLTDDGAYTLGWKNENGIFHSGEVFDTALQFGGIKKAALWGGGALRAVMENDRITDVAAVETGGYGVSVSADEERTVIIHRVVRPANISEAAPARIPVTDAADTELPAENLTFTDKENEKTMTIPAEAVRQMQTFGDGKYLLVKTDTQRIYITDAETGRILLEDRSLATPVGRIWVFEAEAGSRLYLADDFMTHDKGLCIDTESWTVLAEIPGFVCYDSENDVIYRYTDSGEAVRCRLPGTEELVRFTVETFGAP